MQDTLSPLMRFAPLAFAAAVASLPTVSAAQTVSPFTFVASQRFRSDSNVFRVANGVQRDVVSETGLGFEIDQPIGRQRFITQLHAKRNNYKNFDQLNHTGYDALVKLDLATAGDLSGDLSYSQTQQMSAFEQNQFENTVDKNLERNQVVSGRLQLGLASTWVLEGGGAHRSLRNSRDTTAYNASELDANSVNLGIRYRPSDIFTFGLGARRTSGKYPKYPVAADEFDRNDVDFTARWTPSGATTLQGRVSKTSETHTLRQPAEQDLVTSALGVEWRPTGLIGFDLQYLRDTNDAIGTTGATLQTSTFGNAAVTSAVQLTTRLEISATTMATLTLRNARRDLDNQFITGTDNTRLTSLGLAYTPSRVWSVQMGVGRESRTTTNVNLSAPYSATTGYLGAEIRLN